MAAYSKHYPFNKKGRADTKVFFYQGQISFLIPMPPRASVLAEQAREGLSWWQFIFWAVLCSLQGHCEAQTINMSSWEITFHVAWLLVRTWQKVCPCALQLQASGSSNLHWQSSASKRKFSSGSSTVYQQQGHLCCYTVGTHLLWAHVWCRHCCAAFELLKDSCCDSSLTQGSTKPSPPREDCPAVSPTVRCVPLPGLSSYLLS